MSPLDDCFLPKTDDSTSRKHFYDLKNLYEELGICLFTGLGVSCGSQTEATFGIACGSCLPNWEVLTRRVMRHIDGGAEVYGELRARGYTLPAIFTWASGQLTATEFRERLREALYQDLDVPLWTNEYGATFRDKVRATNPTLAAVGALTATFDGKTYSANGKVKAILTTNVDNLLREYTTRAFKKTFVLRSCERASAIPLPRRTNIYYLHGMIRYDQKRSSAKEAADKLIFTDLQYHSIYRDVSHLFTYTPLFLFREHPVLFIGSGMTDDNVRRLLYWSKAEINKAEEEEGKQSKDDWMHYALLKAPEENKLRDVVSHLLLPLRVLPIWYREHEHVPRLLQHLYGNNDAWAELFGVV